MAVSPAPSGLLQVSSVKCEESSGSPGHVPGYVSRDVNIESDI